MINPADFTDFYFDELFSWMNNGAGSAMHPVYTAKDFFKRYDNYPPEPDEKPYTEQWPVINTWDLKIEKERAIERIYYKSPSHHVFVISMLELIKDHPEEFMGSYARKKGLYRLLKANPTEGEVKCLGLLIEELSPYLQTKRHQLIPLLYSPRPDGVLMSCDLEVVTPKGSDNNTMYEFGFSKESSDAFTTLLMNQLTEILHFIQVLANAATATPGKPNMPASCPQSKKLSPSFEDLFYEPSQANMIVEVLKKNDVISATESWVGFTGKNTEVLALIDVLAEKRYIRKYARTQLGRPFCQRFGIMLTDRSLRSKPQVYFDTLDEYRRIVPDL